MAPSSFSFSSTDFSYDVFISFRGTDTRHGFTGHLYKTLSDKGIRTFIDDKELQRGDEITPSLHKSIEHSRIAIIVFSENYATSPDCLDELVHIINYFKEKSRLVLPVFYDVKPSDVRLQTNRYGEALAEFRERFQNDKENMERLQKWKIALYQAANLSGYPFKKEEYEYEFIKKIVTEISNKIKREEGDLKENTAEDMERPFDSLEDLNDSKETWKFAVRIVNLWTAPNKNGGEHIQMVVMDAKGHRVQIYVPTEYVSSWRDDLKEYHSYEMNNFKVHNNDLQFKACKNKYKLLWTGATFVKARDFDDIPNTHFFFKDFSEIQSGNFQCASVIDIIGAFHEMKFTQTNSYKKAKIKFLMRDTSGNLLNCTLWDKYARSFRSLTNQTGGQYPIVFIIRNAAIQPATETYPVCVTNAWSGTRIITNQDLQEIKEFKNKFSNEDKIIFRAEVLTLPQINALKHETCCVTVAKTNKVVTSRSGWTYDGCYMCTKRVSILDGQLQCENGHVNNEPTPRYKVDIEVVYRNAKSKFVFFDGVCTQLLGISASNLRKKMIAAGQKDKRAYPYLFEKKLLNLTMVFRVKWSPTFKTSSVMRFSTDETFLSSVEDKLLKEETTGVPKIAYDSLQQSQNDHVQSVYPSATTEYDPENGSNTIPAKRLSSKEELTSDVVEETPTSKPEGKRFADNFQPCAVNDFCGTETSCTKKRKTTNWEEGTK